MESQTATTGAFQLVVDERKMRAEIVLLDPDARQQVTSELVRNAWIAQQLLIDDQLKNLIDQAIEKINSDPPPKEPVLVKEGSFPKEGEDGQFVWATKYDPIKHSERSRQTNNHYDRTNIVTVSGGEVLGKVNPPTEGTPGENLLGQPIPPREGKTAGLIFGQNVELDKDGLYVRAISGGQLHCLNERIYVTTDLEIPDNVDFESGNIRFDGCVHVGGNVLDRFEVHCTGDLHVSGLIEGALIRVGGNLNAQGGISGKERADIRVGGTLNARFIDNAQIHVQGDATINSEILNSELRCGGILNAAECSIVGGSCNARGGVIARTIGSANSNTSIIAGVNEFSAEQVEHVRHQISVRKAVIEKLNRTIDPLAAEVKRLGPSRQAALATLTQQAKTLRDQINQLTAKRDALQTAIVEDGNEEISVEQIIYQGTTIEFKGFRKTISEPIRGPVQFNIAKIGTGDRDIVARDPEGQDLVPLSATRFRRKLTGSANNE